MKFWENIKFLFLSRGPGETGQARAMATYIKSKGGEILFALNEKKCLSFLAQDRDFKISLIQDPQELKKIIESQKPDVFLIFNSKMWTGYDEFSDHPPFLKPPISFTVDSNWLFNEKKYPSYRFIKWVDKHLVLFPKKIFELGLKEKGGSFEIEKSILKKIIPVGFIPSYKKPSFKNCLEVRKKYGIKKDEKFIFSYFSGFGAGHKVWAFENFIKAAEKLIKKGRKIKAIYVGPTEDLDQTNLKKDWLIIKEKMSARDFFLTLASSDLVFQHQGMVTLAQSISCQIPVIANVSLLKGKEPISRLHFWEVSPFQRAGVCEMFSKSTSIIKIGQKIEELLYNSKVRKKMQINQKLIWENGEKKASKIIKNLIKEKI